MSRLILIWGVALILSWTMVSAANNLRGQVSAATVNMDRVVKEAQTFRLSLKRLQRTAAEFDDLFPEFTQVRDVYSLYKLLDTRSAGLASVAEKLRISRIEEVTRGGQPTGAIKICVTSGSRGLEVTAETLQELVEGMEAFVARDWITASGVAIEARPGQGTLSAQLTDTCLMTRDVEQLNALRQAGGV